MPFNPQHPSAFQTAMLDLECQGALFARYPHPPKRIPRKLPQRVDLPLTSQLITINHPESPLLLAQVHVEGASTAFRHHSEILWIRFSLRAGDDVVPKGCEIPGPQRGRAQRKPEGDTVPGETVPGSATRSAAERRWN